MGLIDVFKKIAIFSKPKKAKDQQEQLQQDQVEQFKPSEPPIYSELFSIGAIRPPVIEEAPIYPLISFDGKLAPVNDDVSILSDSINGSAPTAIVAAKASKSDLCKMTPSVHSFSPKLRARSASVSSSKKLSLKESIVYLQQTQTCFHEFLRKHVNSINLKTFMDLYKNDKALARMGMVFEKDSHSKQTTTEDALMKYLENIPGLLDHSLESAQDPLGIAQKKLNAILCDNWDYTDKDRILALWENKKGKLAKIIESFDKTDTVSKIDTNSMYKMLSQAITSSTSNSKSIKVI